MAEKQTKKKVTKKVAEKQTKKVESPKQVSLAEANRLAWSQDKK